MIVTYLDTSALVRLCVGEGDVSDVERAMAGLPVTSVLAAVELRAAIHARFHHGHVDRKNRNRLLTIADQVLGAVAQTGLSDAVRREAVTACEDHLIRTLDAIHLGTAVVVRRQQRRHGNSLNFCTADQRQGTAAAALLGPGSVLVLPSI